MRVYLSYPMSGKKDHGIKRGEKIVERLRKQYPEHEFVAPHEIMHSPDGTGHFNPDFSHHDYVSDDIAKGLGHCDAIALVDGWPHSTGCMAEAQYASLSGMRFFRVAGVPPVTAVHYGAYWLVLHPLDGCGTL